MQNVIEPKQNTLIILIVSVRHLIHPRLGLFLDIKSICYAAQSPLQLFICQKPLLGGCCARQLCQGQEYDDKQKFSPSWAAWLAQLVKHATSAQVMISQSVGSSPVLGSVLTAQSLEPASDSVSPFLSAPPLLMLCLSLKNIKKKKKKFSRSQSLRIVGKMDLKINAKTQVLSPRSIGVIKCLGGGGLAQMQLF